MAFEQVLLNARTRGTGWMASFLNKSVASFPALLRPIDSSSPPPIFPYFTFANYKRRRAIVPSPSLPSTCYHQSLKGSSLSIHPLYHRKFSFFSS